ncbi:MAG: 4-hydroxy-tetrahydrodipicolinate reductase [Candidatus Binatia bacterium]
MWLKRSVGSVLGLVVCGVGGRMGSVVVRLIRQTPGVKLVGAVDRPGGPRLGRDVGEVVGVGQLGVQVSDRIEAFLSPNVAVIDFTTPAASLAYLRVAAKRGIPIVVGTTGFTRGQLNQVNRLGRRTKALVSPNMSVGVNLLLGLLGRVAQVLGEEYDVEIVEVHHRFKRDAPSGTALAMGRAVAQALKRDLESVGVSGRRGVIGERKKKEIGLMALRAGDIVGEHTVMFGGLGERIEFIHRAHSRETFARGAIRAAQWLVKQKKGLYSMQDVLRLG